MWRSKLPSCGIALCLLVSTLQTSRAQDDDECQNNDSIFQRKYFYPNVWWVVYPSEVPQVANTALILRSALTTSYEDFAEHVLLGVARNQTQAIAKSIGYMVNANATLGGGCPVPPSPSSFLNRVGNGFAASVEYANNLTALFGSKTESELNVPEGGLSRINASAVTDMLLAAMFVAGRSCGPPDALSSSTLEAIKEKYVNSTCYYAGPIFRAVTNNQTLDLPCYNSTFEADIKLANQTDQYVAGPLLAAYKECIVGPPELLNLPPWLFYSFGPVVSIDSGSGGGSSARRGSTSTGITSTSSSSASTGGGSSSILDGELDEPSVTNGR